MAQDIGEMVYSRRHPITGERLRRAGEAAAQLAMKQVSVLLKRRLACSAEDEEMVACTYKGTVCEDEQLNWSTPVTFTWTLKDAAGELAMKVQAGRALGKRTLPMPRVLRLPLVAACLPHLITATRALPCMQKHERAVCRRVALPKASTAPLSKARFGINGKSAEQILCACVNGQQWLLHPVDRKPTPKNFVKSSVPETAYVSSYDGNAADVLIAAATFFR